MKPDPKRGLDQEDEELLNPGHTGVRNVLRVIGPAILALGLLLMLIGFGSFFSSMASFSAGPPKFFWCAFLGMPTLFVGIVLTKVAYAGAVLRYMSAEQAPVAKDTFNYVASGTKDGIRDVASAISSGLAGDAVTCPGCEHPNDQDAVFCDQCGTAMAAEKACPSCQSTNDSDSRFCNFCGSSFGSGV